MISSIKAYMNNKNIDGSIEQVKENIATTQKKNIYLNSFYKPYLVSEYANYFYGHENGLLYDGEKNVHFKNRLPELTQAHTTPEQLPAQPLDVSTPQAAWNYFRRTKIAPAREGAPEKSTTIIP